MYEADIKGARPASHRSASFIEQGLGWAKKWGAVRWMVRGLKRVDHLFVLTMTAYLTRMRSSGQIHPLAS